MHIGCRRAGDLDVEVVPPIPIPVPVTWQAHGLRCQIDAADERRLARLPSVDNPALLMLAEGGVRLIPSDTEL